MIFRCDVLSADFPLLLLLDLMRRERLINDVRDLELEQNGWSLPMKIQNNHLIISWLSNIYYPNVELKKFQRHLRHPRTENLYRLLKRIDP